MAADTVVFKDRYKRTVITLQPLTTGGAISEQLRGPITGSSQLSLTCGQF